MAQTNFFRRVIIPSGKCPVQLESTKDEDILKWACDLRKIEKLGYLTNEALQYWVKDFYDSSTNTEQWKYVRQRIADIVEEQKQVDRKQKKRRGNKK